MREVEGDECPVIELEPSDAPTLYLGLDGTSVSARKTEVEDRENKQRDGTAKTCKSKIAIVWSKGPNDNEG